MAYQAPDGLLKAQRLANLLDNKFAIPLLNVRFGIDPLLGLIPVLGDVISFWLATKIIRYGADIGLPEGLQKAMWRNLIVDFVVGLVPVIGDIADIFYRANQTNVRIIEKWWIGNNKDKVDTIAQQRLAAWQASLND